MSLFDRIVWNTRLNIQKSEYLWNIAAGLLNAAEGVIFSIMITRISGLDAAGIVALGFAVGNLFCTIGKYSVRTFQATDVNREYHFGIYFRTRLITVAMMALVSVAYIIYCCQTRDYSMHKSAVILIICARYAIEAFEDVFAGECQLRGRLDVASKLFIVRSLSFIGSFAIIYITSHHLMRALTAALVLCAGTELYLIRMLSERLQPDISFGIEKGCLLLLKRCLPVFLSGFFFFYITNAPKYAIDRVMDDAAQACYSFIAYPVFAIELLNNFIYQPRIVRIAQAWDAHEYRALKKAIHRQLFLILVLAATAFLFAYVLGIPLLSAIFSTDLNACKKEMLGLILGGGMLAVIGFLSTILITVRHTIPMICGYFCAFILSLWIYIPAITRFGMMGAVAIYFGLCSLLSLYEYIAIAVIFRSTVNKNRNSANK